MSTVDRPSAAVSTAPDDAIRHGEPAASTTRFADSATGRPGPPSAPAWSAWTGRLARADVWALRLVTLALLPVAVLVTSGWLYIDDLRAQVYASGRSWWPFVVESNNTHLAPSARTVDWWQARYAPLEHWPAVVYTITLHAALGLALWWVLRELVGPRLLALPFLALALLNPATVPSTAWFRQALTTQSGLVLSLVAVGAMLSAARTGRWRWAVVVVTVAVGVGLGFSERCLAAVPLGAVLVILRERTAGRRVPWLRLVGAAVPAGLVSLLFLWVYRSGEYDHGGAARADWLNLPRLAWHSLSRGVLPSLLGGPWRWTSVPPSYGLANPPAALVVAGLVAGAALLAAGLAVRRRSTGWALVAFGCYALPVWAMLFLGRFPAGSLGGADDLRLWPDITTMAVICIAAVVLGTPDRPAGQASPPDRRRPSRPGRRRRPMGARSTALGAALVVAVVVGSTVSWTSFGQHWARNGARPYVTGLSAALPKSTGTVLPTSVPDSVIPAWVQADFTSADLVRLLDPRRVTGVVDGPALAATTTGALRPAVLSTWGRATPTSAGFCGFARPRDAVGWLTVPFDRSVPYYRSSLLRLSLLVDDSTSVRVRLVDRSGATIDLGVVGPRLQRGPHVLIASLPYRTTVSAVEVLPTASVGLCVPGAAVVTAAPS